MKIEQKVGYLTAKDTHDDEMGDAFVVGRHEARSSVRKCVYMIVPLDCPTPGDEAVDFAGNRFTVALMRPGVATGHPIWLDSSGNRYHGCTLYTEPDDSEVMVSLADVRKAISGEQGMQWTRLSELAEKVADRLRAGASDE